MIQLHKRILRFPWRKVLALSCALLVCTALWAEAQQSQLAAGMVRMHVLANSDSPADQALKLVVRDKILAETKTLLAGQTDAAGAETVLRENLATLAHLAEQTIYDEGYPYTVSVRLENTWFPTRQYDTFALPAGPYNALRVLIGNGAGHNWWCVVFPPLCLSSVTETSVETAGMTDEDYAMITEQNQGYVIKFRVVELWEQWKHTLFPA